VTSDSTTTETSPKPQDNTGPKTLRQIATESAGNGPRNIAAGLVPPKLDVEPIMVGTEEP